MSAKATAAKNLESVVMTAIADAKWNASLTTAEVTAIVQAALLKS